MWTLLIFGACLSAGWVAGSLFMSWLHRAPIVEAKPRIAWDMEPFSKEIRWRVIVPETRGTVVVNEATIRHLERVL